MKKWRLAKSLERLLMQVNNEWPNRDKKSDGAIGDLAHQNRPSDHNPNAQGVVTAIDIDADLSAIENVKVLVHALFSSRDARIKYIIFDKQITTRDSHGIISGWTTYNGENAHEKHAHISVKGSKSFYDNTKDWDI